MKKFRKSPVAIACYVLAALLAVYFVTVVVSTITTINEYYASYGMSATAGEVISYLLQNGVSPFTSALLTFMAGFILEEVRKNNPANWMTDEELAEAKEAKKMAREAKQIAKGEAAKAAAEAKEAAGDDESIKAEFAAVVADAGDDTVVFEDDGDEDVLTEADSAAAQEEPYEAAQDAEEAHEEFNDTFSVDVAEDAAEEAAEDAADAAAEITEDAADAAVDAEALAEKVDEDMADELRKAVEKSGK